MSQRRSNMQVTTLARVTEQAPSNLRATGARRAFVVADGLWLLLRIGLGRQQGEAANAGCTGICGVGGDGDVRIAWQSEVVVREVHRSDDWVVDDLASAGAAAHVVLGPAGAEIGAARGEFADEFGDLLVQRITPGGRAEYRDQQVLGLVEVGVEVLRARVEEHVSGEVRWLLGRGEQVGIQGVAQVVGREEIQATVLHHRVCTA